MSMIIGIIAIHSLELTFVGCLLVLCTVVFVQESLGKTMTATVPARCESCQGTCVIRALPRRIYECGKCGQKWYAPEHYGGEGGGNLGN